MIQSAIPAQIGIVFVSVFLFAISDTIVGHLPFVYQQVIVEGFHREGREATPSEIGALAVSAIMQHSVPLVIVSVTCIIGEAKYWNSIYSPIIIVLVLGWRTYLLGDAIYCKCTLSRVPLTSRRLPTKDRAG